VQPKPRNRSDQLSGAKAATVGQTRVTAETDDKLRGRPEVPGYFNRRKFGAEPITVGDRAVFAMTPSSSTSHAPVSDRDGRSSNDR
jgi:hypothetical protein